MSTDKITPMKMLSKQEREMSKCEFINRHKELCQRSFSFNDNYSGGKTPMGRDLVLIARKELLYSKRTADVDIYHGLVKTNNKFNIVPYTKTRCLKEM